MTTYYHRVRRDIQPLLPDAASRILEVGAAAGNTLAWLKTIYPKAHTTGVELNAELKAELENTADVAIFESIEECVTRLQTFDLILLLDVLEHVPDSTRTLQRVRQLLEPGGRVIVSLPNIAHLSVALPLLTRRRFTYQDAGILDRTHLRFFVEDTAVKLLNDANLVVTKGLIGGLQGPKSKLLDQLSFGLFRHHLAKQYIMAGETADGRASQGRVSWQIAD
ncbi:class I SAM-dependent methyltransferase [Rhodoblastus sp.]|jgi:2-polyprenyl-3-methyl-5-hydroxy-6-metoxy-1,4-benzoquinol methylase|uniref:class I SAM-dependent methyltransferase n=1 Tax=Rhodoblastus sp. TaxID=1962975 RepID=UPI00263351F9|nr:class I SAM-dependent methyltransferase [Rhodoblastus sp.]